MGVRYLVFNVTGNDDATLERRLNEYVEQLGGRCHSIKSKRDVHNTVTTHRIVWEAPADTTESHGNGE